MASGPSYSERSPSRCYSGACTTKLKTCLPIATYSRKQFTMDGLKLRHVKIEVKKKILKINQNLKFSKSIYFTEIHGNIFY